MKKYLVISIFAIFHLLLGMRIVSAGETFQNNLLKVDLYESSLGGVKMTLYTNKPYTDTVRVNKKSDSEYVILMPETSNSLTAKPSLRAASNAVKNVEVKTQQYSGQIKGYTKIVVTTSKPVEIMPQVQVLSGAPQISEKEYNELIAQSAKKNIGKTVTKPVQTAAKAPMKSATKPLAKPPVYVQKPRESVKTITSETKATATKTVAKKPAVEQKTARPNVVNASKVSTIKAVKETPKKVEAPVIKKAEAPKKETVVTTPVAKAPIAKTTTEETLKQEVVTPALTSETQTPTLKPEEKVGPAPVATTLEQPPVAPVKETNKLQVYKHMIKNQVKATMKKNNVYTLAGMALIPIILLLLILRVIGKSVKKMRAQKSSFMANLKEKPVKTTDIAGKITEDMNWKEKFKTYTEATKERAQDQAASDSMQESPELDDLFGEDEFPHIEESGVSPGTVQEENLYGEIPAESAQTEGAQDYEDPSADIYKEVDAYYDNLSQGGETFEEPVVQTAAPTTESSGLDLFGSEMGQDQNRYISDEDISLDELFGAEEEEIAPRSVESFGYGVNPLIEVPGEELVEEPVATQKDFQVEFSDDFSFDTALMEDENQIVEGLTEELTEEAGEEIVTSEFVIDHNKGFYLVDFEDTTALVGHIADEIFVLKKFDKKIEGSLQARMDERKENSINYMTKVGKFKALVEVTPKNMNLLIEL